ncbi:unnamed protein product [Diatraea saccharalis]|uniref:Lysosome-associated membrane glycoprotein 5 n=1 Tax=Diatraea saccharalis TaxID=40085 RepID=A0A9P0C6H8_9NEOP|nr:unnamed protein product [Diatraea saccharalis]
MSKIRFFVFLAVLCSCTLLGRGDILPPKTEVIDLVPTAPETVSPEITPPEVDTDVTKHNTTTSSTTSTTTTTTTTTTTPKPTTTPKTTTSTTTTEAPTTTPAPAPTPKPGPVPAPDQGTWMYTDEKNVTCIVVQFSAQLNISYNQNVESNVTRTASVLVNVPANLSLVNVTGNCNGSAQYIQLSWSSGVLNSTVMNSLRLNFLRNDTTKVYALRSINVTVDAKIMVNSSTPGDKVQLSYGEAWQTPVGTSYRCARGTQLNLTAEPEAAEIAAALTVAALQEEAYRTSHGKGFSAARDCGGADLPDAVPIAVGCALGGLVLVVLVAYLVARRRSAARGYLSM